MLALSVDASRGSRVEVACTPRLQDRGEARRRRGELKFRRIRGKNLRAGSKIEIRVTQRRAIGAYIAYRIKDGNFEKIERCLRPGSEATEATVSLTAPRLALATAARRSGLRGRLRAGKCGWRRRGELRRQRRDAVHAGRRGPRGERAGPARRRARRWCPLPRRPRPPRALPRRPRPQLRSRAPRCRAHRRPALRRRARLRQVAAVAAVVAAARSSRASRRPVAPSRNHRRGIPGRGACSARAGWAPSTAPPSSR